MNLEKIDKILHDFEITLNNKVRKKQIEIERKQMPFQTDKEVLLLIASYLHGLSIIKANRKIEFDFSKKNKGFYFPFALIGNECTLCFDIRQLNEAEEWNIVNENNGYIITKTIGSFLNNKIWAWLDRNRAIWKIENY